MSGEGWRRRMVWGVKVLADFAESVKSVSLSPTARSRRSCAFCVVARQAFIRVLEVLLLDSVFLTDAMLAAMKRFLKRITGSLPGLSQLVFLKGVLRGHFYSPVPSLREVHRHRKQIFDVPTEIPGVGLHEEEQLKLIERFADDYYSEQPFSEAFLQNDQFRYSDAIVLFCMLRHSCPRRLIEVGSGYSSQVTLETNRPFFGGAIECLFSIRTVPIRFLESGSRNRDSQKENPGRTAGHVFGIECGRHFVH